jgi:hypothetical protein
VNRRTCPMAVLLLFALGLPAAQATTILFDNFDGYADQAAFQTAWPAIGTVAPISAELSTAQASSPTQSVEIDGEPNAGVNGKQRNRRSFAETGTGSATEKVVWSFDFYDTNGAASPYRQYSNLQDTTGPGGTNQLVSMGLNNNKSVVDSGGNYYMARILGYTTTSNPDPDGGPVEGGTLGPSQYFKLNDFGVGLRSTGWHRLKVAISSDDGISTDYSFYVDGLLAEKVSNVGVAGSLRSYDNIAIGSGFTNAGNAAYYDNMWVRRVPIPEPTTFALVALGLAGFVAGSRRRSA